MTLTPHIMTEDSTPGRRSSRLTARAMSSVPVPGGSDEMDVDSQDVAYPESDDELPAKTLKPTQSRKRKIPVDESFNPKADEHRAKKVRGKRGLLRQLTEMPLDILFEIFGQLNPLDVLNLARTTKALRGILMQRSAVSVWKQACANISGFPPCPEDLTEPQFINLAFGKQCHFCLSSTGTQVISWEERVRTCLKCIDKHFTSSNHGYVYIHGVPEKVATCIPVTRVTKASGRRPRLFIYRCDETIDRFKEEYSARKDDTQAVTEWISTKEKERVARLEHVKLCEKWVSEQNEDRLREVEVARNRRKDLIIEKLSELGWGDEIAKGQNRKRLSEHSLVTQKKELTDRVWNNVKDQLVAFMGALKVARSREDRKAMLKKRQHLIKQVRSDYVATCAVNEVIPPASDFYLFPPLRHIVEDTPVEVEVTLETFHEVMNLIPDFIAVWKVQTCEKLRGMIAEANKKDEPQVDTPVTPQPDVNLATAVFRCSKYECNLSRPLFYPAVLMHACASEYTYIHAIEDDDEDLVDFSTNCRLRPWNGGKVISFFTAASQTAAELVELCGRDRKTTTIQEMDCANPIFECEHCRSERQGRLMMTWRRGLTHTHFAGPAGLKLTLPDEETQAKVRLRMAEEVDRKRARSCDRSLCCVHCHLTGDSVSLKKHMAETHQKTQMTSSDVVLYIDADHEPDNYYLWTPVYV